MLIFCIEIFHWNIRQCAQNLIQQHKGCIWIVITDLLNIPDYRGQMKSYSLYRKEIHSVVLVTSAQFFPFILQTRLISFLNSVKICYKPKRNSISLLYLGKSLMCLKKKKKSRKWKTHATLFVKVNVIQQSSVSNKDL